VANELTDIGALMEQEAGSQAKKLRTEDVAEALPERPNEPICSFYLKTVGSLHILIFYALPHWVKIESH
jgi:hypothetical protein